MEKKDKRLRIHLKKGKKVADITTTPIRSSGMFNLKKWSIFKTAPFFFICKTYLSFNYKPMYF